NLLLEVDANPDAPIATGETPLMTCARAGVADAVRALLARGADVNAKEPTQQQTALMWAAAERHQKVLQTLIEAKADPPAPTNSGLRGLHFGARAGDLESVRILLDGGVDVNIRWRPDPEPDRGAETSGASGGRGGAPQGARPGGFGERGGTSFPGSTALLVAAVRGHVRLALFLLDRGANPNILDARVAPLPWAAGTWENGLANPVY